MAYEREDRKRYCMKCEEMRLVSAFELKPGGGLERNCNLHGETKATVEEPTAEGQKFCVVCSELRPIDDFDPWPKGRNNRVCKRHSSNGERSTSMTEEEAEMRYCIACTTDRPVENFKRRGRGLSRECNLHKGAGESHSAPVANNRPGEVLVPTSSRGLQRSSPPSSSVHPALAMNGHYAKLFREQNGRCAVCRNPESARDEIGQVLPLSLYGSAHFNGRVQGLLCKLCNMGLSMFRDSPALLADAIAFLTRKPQTVEGDARMVNHH